MFRDVTPVSHRALRLRESSSGPLGRPGLLQHGAPGPAKDEPEVGVSGTSWGPDEGLCWGRGAGEEQG